MKTILILLIIAAIVFGLENPLLGPSDAVRFARAQVGKGYSQAQCTGRPGNHTYQPIHILR